MRGSTLRASCHRRQPPPQQPGAHHANRDLYILQCSLISRTSSHGPERPCTSLRRSISTNQRSPRAKRCAVSCRQRCRCLSAQARDQGFPYVRAYTTCIDSPSLRHIASARRPPSVHPASAWPCNNPSQVCSSYNTIRAFQTGPSLSCHLRSCNDSEGVILLATHRAAIILHAHRKCACELHSTPAFSGSVFVVATRCKARKGHS